MMRENYSVTCGNVVCSPIDGICDIDPFQLKAARHDRHAPQRSRLITAPPRAYRTTFYQELGSSNARNTLSVTKFLRFASRPRARARVERHPFAPIL